MKRVNVDMLNSTPSIPQFLNKKKLKELQVMSILASNFGLIQTDF